MVKNDNKRMMTRAKRYKNVNKSVVKKKKIKKPIKRNVNYRQVTKKRPVKRIVNSKARIIRRKRKVAKIKRIIFILLVIAFLVGVISYFIKDDHQNDQVDKKNSTSDKAELLIKYDDCLARSYDITAESEEIKKYKTSLDSYFKANYVASIYYEEEARGFSYHYNQDAIYYAASTIKMLVAIYIYDQVINDKLDLNKTITYQSKYVLNDSRKTKEHRIGAKISLKELVNYAITVSDNSAHAMLVDYIGFQKLKAYGQSLGAKYTLTGGDKYGQITVGDAEVYLKKLNELFANPTYGEELKEIFILADQNYLSIADKEIVSAHKYGEYYAVYHDIGIVYDQYPYYIAILTNSGIVNNEDLITNINAKVYDLHELYIANQQTKCQQEVYGQK